MTPEQLTTAYWIFGSIFTVLAVMIGLTSYFGGPAKKQGDIGALQDHEESRERQARKIDKHTTDSN